MDSHMICIFPTNQPTPPPTSFDGESQWALPLSVCDPIHSHGPSASPRGVPRLHLRHARQSWNIGTSAYSKCFVGCAASPTDSRVPCQDLTSATTHYGGE